MIARSWDGVTKAEQADAYADYVRRTGVKDLTATPGNRGVYLLRRRDGTQVLFRVLSLWDGLEAIRRYAGPEPERARYYPEDERFLVALAPNVEHFDVVTEVAPPAESGALAKELEALAHGDAWHGPSLEGLLEGVSAHTAAARPITGAHTIWELVLHLTGWTDVFRRRLEGHALDEPEAGDFPAAPRPTPVAWDQAREALFEAHARLMERVAGLSEAELVARVPGRDFDTRFLVRGAIRHTVYHSGQIGLLRKHASEG